MDGNMDRARGLINTLVQTNKERFIDNGAFLSPQWWLLLAFLIVPWTIFVMVVDKNRKLEIVVVGLFIAITTQLLDLIGYNLDLWDYPIQIIPLVPAAFSFDLSLIPVAYMLLYQYFKTWKSYCIGLVCWSVFSAFIAEPYCNWIMVVIYIKWKYIYSIMYYILIGIIVRAIVENIKKET